MFRDRSASVLAMVAVAGILMPTVIAAQVTFQRTYGGTGDDIGSAVQQCTDSGYVITGFTSSFGAGSDDVYLVRTNARGETLWTRTFGGAMWDGGNCVQQTVDGGFVIVGSTQSFGAGSVDVYLVKTDASGDTIWTRTFGGTGIETGTSVQQTADSGYVIVGFSSSFGAGAADVYLIKTRANGDTMWTRTFGSAFNYEAGNSVRQTADGGYVVAGEKTPVSTGLGDVWFLKTNSHGDTLWTRTFGGDSVEVAKDVRQTAEGGYLVGGSTRSFGAGANDVYLVRTDSNGNQEWCGAYGGTGADVGASTLQVGDDAYVVAGASASFGAGGDDVYLVKTDADGDLLWTQTFGGDSNDVAYSVQRTRDGGYVMAGYTASAGAGGYDVWLIKTDSLGSVGAAEPRTNSTPTRGFAVTCEPNPCRGTTTVGLKLQASSSKPVALRVYDASGCLVHSESGLRTSSFRLDLWSMPVGAYFVRCDVAGQHATARLVVQR